MKIDTFLAHHHVKENPFGAEEARHDPVFDRLIESDLSHPDFGKVMGRVDRPGTSVVFGEKGSGKTAIRIMLANQIARHNAEQPDKRVLVVPYDDLNPVLDQLQSASGGSEESTLSSIRLEDHQDAILSIAVTRVVDMLLGTQRREDEAGEPTAQWAPGVVTHHPKQLKKMIKRMSRQTRMDLAVLAALYDKPSAGSVVSRHSKLRSKLKLGWLGPVPWPWLGAMVATLAAVGLGFAYLWYFLTSEQPVWLLPTMGLAVAAMLVMWSAWAWDTIARRSLCGRITRQMPTVNRSPGELAKLFEEMNSGSLDNESLPTSAEVGRECRYQLTRRFIDVLSGLGYAGIVVLVDRVDEPTLVQGKPERMRAVIWPMLDNKFLQQKGVGIKLLLPIELRYLVHRESPAFFEEARLDKQHMVDRLVWSGATLYDICTSRLRACQTGTGEDGKPIQLMDLFEPDVSRDAVIDALDQMQQPRDAFKFLYNLIQEHCRLSPEDAPSYKIARITLENVRRAQAQRVQDMQRGLAPA